jgi:hypothetical protein
MCCPEMDDIVQAYILRPRGGAFVQVVRCIWKRRPAAPNKSITRAERKIKFSIALMHTPDLS